MGEATGAAVNKSARRMLLGIVAAAVMLSASACSSSDSTYLPALQADEMASWQPEGADLLRESEQGYTDGDVTSKQSLAHVTRVFRLPALEQVRQAQRAALEYAQSQAGWQADELDREGFLQRPGPADSTMTLSVLPSVTSDNELVVKLTAP